MTHAEPNDGLSRRGFLVASSALIAGTSVAAAASACSEGSTAAASPPAASAAASSALKATDFVQPALPWKEDALEPVISATTIGVHYGKHHKTYFENLNKAVAGKPYATMTLEEVVAKSAKETADIGIFNNSAQAWNHTFYWNSLAPVSNGAKPPEGKLADKIKSDFGSLDECKKQLLDAAKSQFGSGWAWLVMDGDKLKVTKTGNADNPLVHGQKPLLTIDVWEHAYYLDYKNLRADYVQKVLDKLLNWEFAAKNMG